MSNIFIASKVKVGFQKRQDTFTGQLAYIIYYDEKGKLRKEKSWDSWRDHKIAPQEFDNTPMDGFTLNKDVQRSRDWFGSGRNMIRIHDPRGFEFEVTCENLIEILMHTDCLKRGLQGQFVYAWVGTELILLPTNSEEYQKASKYTSGLGKKVSAKELVAGISYKTKREGDVVYIGKFNWYEYVGTNKYSGGEGLRKEEKVHVFTNDDGKSFMKKKSADFLSEANTNVPVSNLAELVDKFNKKSYANKIVNVEFVKTTFNPTVVERKWHGLKLKRDHYFVPNGIGVFIEYSVAASIRNEIDSSGKQKKDENGNNVYTVTGYTPQSNYYDEFSAIKDKTGELFKVPNPDRRTGYYWNRSSDLSLETMNKKDLYDMYVVFENGKRKRVNTIYDLYNERDEIEDYE